MARYTGSIPGRWPRGARKYAAWAAAAASLAAASPAGASHLYSYVVHHRVPDPAGAPYTVEITVDFGSQAGYPTAVPVGLAFGDGTGGSGAPGQLVSSPALASGGGYEIHRRVLLHTYPGPGTYTLSHSDCCTASFLSNGADSSFGFHMPLQLPSTGKGGSVLSLPPVVHLQTGGLRTYRILARDHDADPIHCRFATSAESEFMDYFPQIPGGAGPTISDDPEGCLLTWDTTGGLAGQGFGLGVVLESGPAGQEAVSIAGFIVRLTAAPPPTCDGGGILPIDLGVPSVFSFLGESFGGSDLTLGSIGVFGLLTPADGTVGASPFGAEDAITPLPGDEGLHAMNVVLRNQQNIAGDCPVILEVAACPSFGMPCSAGTGACEATGFLACDGGQVTCSAVPGAPSAELCNGLDDDCDGAIDEDDPGAGQPCSTGLPGACDAGTTACSGGATSCLPDVTPGSVPETCNGVDDDCDGTIDGGFDVGAACTAGVGACAASGVLACDGAGSTTCTAVPGQPTEEVCDGVDNDCNGAVDDGCIGGTGGAGTGGAGTGGAGTGGVGAAGGMDTGGVGTGGAGTGGVGAAGGMDTGGVGTGGQGASGGMDTGGVGASGGQGGSAGSAETGGGAGDPDVPVTGCACRTGDGPAGGGTTPVVALLVPLLLRRRRRARGRA